MHATRFQRKFPLNTPIGLQANNSKIYNTLLVDKNYRTPAAAQASSNVVRCALAAIAVAFLQDMIDAMGIGWTFTFLGGLCLVAVGLFYVDYHKGTVWRQKSNSSLSNQESR